MTITPFEPEALDCMLVFVLVAALCRSIPALERELEFELHSGRLERWM